MSGAALRRGEAMTLLGPEDPPPAEVLNPEGAAPVLVLCDHASRAVPKRLGLLGLDESLLMRHIGWDIGAAEVAGELVRILDAPAVLTGFSRLVVDCNRGLEDPTAMPEVGDEVPVPGNRRLTATERAERADALYWPYHGAIEARLDAFAEREIHPAIVSIHSFTPVMNGFVRPWHVGVLWDKDPRIAVPLLRNLQAPGRVIGDNQPYSAKEPTGYSMRRHAVPHGLPHALLEIRQDLIDTPSGAAAWARIIADALAPILANSALYRREVFG